MSGQPDQEDKTRDRRGPGLHIYIAALSAAAMAGFAAAAFWLSPIAQGPSEARAPAAAQSVASDKANAPEASAGMEKLVVHDFPREVPEFGFIDGDGEARTLRHWRGKMLLVNIWATWCAPCKEEMPALSRLQAKRGGEDFAVLPISVDRGGLDKPRAFLEQIGADNLPLLLEQSGRLNVKLDVLGLPATLIVDAQGREVARMIGPAEWDAPQAITRLEELMAR